MAADLQLVLFLHQVGSEFAVGPLEQQRQIEALRVLDAVLASLMSEEGMSFAGLNFHVYHPETCPLGGFGLHEGSDHFGLGAGHLMRSHVADDGCLHVVADRSEAALAGAVAAADATAGAS